jgi:transglutaminase-like putative cysteine protease
VVLAEATLDGDPPAQAAAAPGPAPKAAAAEAIGAEKDPREKVELLLDWLDEEMTREYRAGTADAGRVLEDRAGDATEFTRAFVAMSRAIGIPARPRVGFVARRTAFYLHTWAEVWLDGWIEVDPYLGQLPADLTHIRLAAVDGPAVEAPAKIAGLEKLRFHVDAPEDSASTNVAKGG